MPKYEITKKQLLELQKTFSFYDADGDGEINKKDLKKVLNKMGSQASEQELDEIMNNADYNGNGAIDFPEFVNIVLHPEKGTDDDYKQLFKMFDKDGDGFIDVAELQEGMIKMGEDFSRDEIKNIILSVDSDKNQKLDYNEFLELIKEKL